MEEESKKICFSNKEEEFKAESKRREERRDTILNRLLKLISNRMKNFGMTMPWQIPDLAQDFIKCYILQYCEVLSGKATIGKSHIKTNSRIGTT